MKIIEVPVTLVQNATKVVGMLSIFEDVAQMLCHPDYFGLFPSYELVGEDKKLKSVSVGSIPKGEISDENSSHSTT